MPFFCVLTKFYLDLTEKNVDLAVMLRPERISVSAGVDVRFARSGCPFPPESHRKINIFFAGINTFFCKVKVFSGRVIFGRSRSCLHTARRYAEAFYDQRGGA